MKTFLRLTVFLLCLVLLGGCTNSGGTAPRADAPALETSGPIELHPGTDAPLIETSAPVGAVKVCMMRDDSEGEKVFFEGQDV